MTGRTRSGRSGNRPTTLPDAGSALPIDAPWRGCNKLYTVQLHKGERIGFERAADGRVIAISGDTRWPLPEDDYGWYRPNNRFESTLEALVYAPGRLVGACVVIGILSLGGGPGPY